LVLSAVSLDRSDGFVVGGSNANIADHPHTVSIRSSDSHSCGGALVANNKAVTAAHCGGGATRQYSLLAGSTSRTDTTCSTCVLVSSINDFNRHPDFSNIGIRGYPNDIATVRFNAITLNSNISPITMAAADAGAFTGQNCVTTGWGRTVGSNSALPTILQAGTLRVLTNAVCLGHWGPAAINDGHLCGQSDTVSACNGDDGSPLVCGTTLVGTFSWVDGGCTPGGSTPSVFSRISFFREWIDTN